MFSNNNLSLDRKKGLKIQENKEIETQIKQAKLLTDQAFDIVECDEMWSFIQNTYKKIIPQEKHYIGKDQTYTVEGYNASFRDDLGRLHRKTRAYSKSKKMLCYSLSCYIHKHNNLKLKLLNSMLGV